MTANGKGRKHSTQSEAPLAEWVAGGIGLVLLGVAILVLTAEALQRDSLPPAVTVSVLAVSPQPEGWLVEIQVSNGGDETAAALGIEGSLASGADVVETSEATIDYLPPHSQRRAGLFFTRNPAELELRLRPVGYEEP